MLGPLDVYLIVAVQVKSNFCRNFVVELVTHCKYS